MCRSLWLINALGALIIGRVLGIIFRLFSGVSRISSSKVPNIVTCLG